MASMVLFCHLVAHFFESVVENVTELTETCRMIRLRLPEGVRFEIPLGHHVYLRRRKGSELKFRFESLMSMQILAFSVRTHQ